MSREHIVGLHQLPSKAIPPLDSKLGVQGFSMVFLRVFIELGVNSVIVPNKNFERTERSTTYRLASGWSPSSCISCFRFRFSILPYRGHETPATLFPLLEICENIMIERSRRLDKLLPAPGPASSRFALPPIRENRRIHPCLPPTATILRGLQFIAESGLYPDSC